MITGELKNKIDKIWETLWSGGISNPLTIIEQLTFLLFIKGLDDVEKGKEKKANRLKRAVENPTFAPHQQHLRWSDFKEQAPETMFNTVKDEVFPFIKTMGANNGEATSFQKHMADAIFMIPTPRVLTNVVDQLADIEMDSTDTKGDLYEYMLSKIASAGQNGQFRTPRHIIELMVDMMQPTPQDSICDPACGTAGFLVASAQYLQQHHQADIYANPEATHKFNTQTLFGYDFDTTMLRIGSMNLQLHGVENPDISYKDSLAGSDEDDSEKFSLILANPPFKGSLDYESTDKDLLSVVKTKKTELLFMALMLKQLKVGGRCAVIVPDGVLFGSSKAHKTIRKLLVEDNKLEGVVSMPSGVFKPYAGVSTAILIFTKVGRAGAGGTNDVWFYDMQADGYSLDDKRTAQDTSDIKDIISRWHDFKADPSTENARTRTEQSFTVPKAEIAENDYDLSINRYKEVVYETVEYQAPQTILATLAQLEQDIQAGQTELQELIK